MITSIITLYNWINLTFKIENTMNFLFGDAFAFKKMVPVCYRTNRITFFCLVSFLITGFFYAVNPALYLLLQLAVITLLCTIFCVKLFKYKELDVFMAVVLGLMALTFSLDLSYFLTPIL